MPESVGFTGTRSLNPMEDIGRLMMILEALPTGTAIVTGACIGVDSFIASQAHNFGLSVHTVVPADRSRVDRRWRDHCDTFEEMASGTDYRARNVRIVELSTRVIAVPDHAEDAPESRRSGTWMTVRIARKAGKPVDVHVLCRKCRQQGPTDAP